MTARASSHRWQPGLPMRRHAGLPRVTDRPLPGSAVTAGTIGSSVPIWRRPHRMPWPTLRWRSPQATATIWGRLTRLEEAGPLGRAGATPSDGGLHRRGRCRTSRTGVRPRSPAVVAPRHTGSLAPATTCGTRRFLADLRTALSALEGPAPAGPSPTSRPRAGFGPGSGAERLRAGRGTGRAGPAGGRARRSGCSTSATSTWSTGTSTSGWATRSSRRTSPRETFMRALRRIDSFSWQGRDIAAWFITIARNLIMDNAKSARFRLEVTTADMLDADQRADAAPEERGPRRASAMPGSSTRSRPSSPSRPSASSCGSSRGCPSPRPRRCSASPRAPSSSSSCAPCGPSARSWRASSGDRQHT